MHKHTYFSNNYFNRGIELVIILIAIRKKDVLSLAWLRKTESHPRPITVDNDMGWDWEDLKIAALGWD